MKRLLIFSLAFMLTSICLAQKDVTKFLGIPVDGNKIDMVKKLKDKGFIYNVTKECLEGEFNGRDVELHLVSNNNKVYRIFIKDAVGVDETEIKVRFNQLCRQFKKNEKYIPADFEGKYELNEDEDISYEMLVHKKRYEASYYQLGAAQWDSTAIYEYFQSELSQMFSFEELEKLNETDKAELQLVLFAKYVEDVISKKSVWFMIDESFGKYYILMYYDNHYNKADGEDL